LELIVAAEVEGVALNMLIDRGDTSTKKLVASASAAGASPPRSREPGNSSFAPSEALNATIDFARSVKLKREANDRLAAKNAAKAEENVATKPKPHSGPMIAYKTSTGKIAYRKNPYFNGP
jgi:hypothetical protein